MKISHLLFLALVATALSTTACKDNKETTTTPEQTVSPEGAMTVDPAATTSTVAATPAGGTEAHYKCTKAGCTGTGTQQGKCSICGSDLAHNQAFHAQAGAAGSSPSNPVQIDPATGKPSAAGTPTPPAAQNAKGEYHYTCAAGHPGAATAGNCAKCGQPLTHNQAYHQQ
ncbi:MAG: hypothetical protein IPL92_05425 [Saprospiraceae bacterium]|nr:hypothetical protein [Candidatus Opimibacter iunctus]